MSAESVINLTSVSKTYRGGVKALQDVSLRVEPGEVYGLLGPNGAGKSTLVKILTTVIRASKCEGTMLGKPVGSRAALRQIGYLPEHHQFAPYLTGEQVLDFFGAMSHVGRRERKRRSKELLDRVGLGKWGGKRVKQYSKGMRQRLGIANALLSDPQIVFLDEPTDGVDPVGRRDIRVILTELRDAGKTVFLNSHLLSELEMVCDRVGILVKGRVATEGTLDELTEGQLAYEVAVAPTKESDAQLRQVLARIALVGEDGKGEGGQEIAPGVTAEIAEHAIRIKSIEAAHVQPVIDAVRNDGLSIVSVVRKRPTLEDLFIAAVQSDGDSSEGVEA